ncbi:MAG: class I SAM-dependent methyltransferase [Chloroflexi bacterium]|nr:class I SAM-dependent methyltransferase [Chloroflexota bacterium]
MSTDHIKKAIETGWDEMSDSYQAESRISLDDVHYAPLAPGERELKLLGDVRGRRVLELACGAAQNSIALAKWGARVIGMDISARQLQRARELIAQEGVRVALVRGDMERLLMFRDESFDIVLSSFGWEFVPDLAACFAECARVLRKGGVLVVCTVHPLTAFEWDADEGALIVHDYFNPPIEVWKEPSASSQKGLTFFHTVQDIFESLVSSGFSVERILEPYPYPAHTMTEDEKRIIPYRGVYWESQYERLSRVPFAIVYRAKKS